MLPETQTFLIAMTANADISTEQVAQTVAQAMVDNHQTITSAVVEAMGSNDDEVNVEITNGLFSNRRLSMYVGDTFRNDPGTDPDHYPAEVKQFSVAFIAADMASISEGHDVSDDVSLQLMDQVTNLCNGVSENIKERLFIDVEVPNVVSEIRANHNDVFLELEEPTGDSAIHMWTNGPDEGAKVFDGLLSIVSGMKDQLGIGQIPQEINEITVTPDNIFFKRNLS